VWHLPCLCFDYYHSNYISISTLEYLLKLKVMSGDQSVSLKNFQMEEHPSARNAPSPAKSDTEFPECSPSGNVYQGFEADILEGMEYSDNEDHPQTEHMEDHHKIQGDGKIIPPGMEYATPPTSVSPRGIGGVTGVVKSAAALAAAHVVNEALVRPLSETTTNVIGSVIGHLPLQTVTSPPHGATYHIPNSSVETIPAFGVTPGRPPIITMSIIRIISYTLMKCKKVSSNKHAYKSN
jgi:hypothetical protein